MPSPSTNAISFTPITEARRDARPPRLVDDLLPLVVDESGAFIEKKGRRISFAKRIATRRILAALARARLEAPGKALTAAELVSAGWPGERIMKAAAKNRLRVAIAWLRKNGLGRSLVSVGDGYLLDCCAIGKALDTGGLEESSPEEEARSS